MKTAVKIVLLCSIVSLAGGCAMNHVAADEITIEGVYVKTLSHPFTGPAIMAGGGYYFLSGKHAEDLAELKDKTNVRVSGRLYTKKKRIPQAGTFKEITEQVIEVTTFTVIGK
jgi:hypothetical protein